jgi:hypothetical protein
MANDCRPSKIKSKKGMLVHDEKEDDMNYRNEMTLYKIIKNEYLNSTSLL